MRPLCLRITLRWLSSFRLFELPSPKLKAKHLNKRGNMDHSEKKQKAFEAAARPMMELLAANYHPHMSATITSTTAELFEGHLTFKTEDYIDDQPERGTT